MRVPDDQIRTEEVKSWQGLHLLHFVASSCSQKVRILLREKGLQWESHPVDLMREKHVTPWFLGINARGVVPVLVHDGAVHVESNDIMEVLDGLPSQAEPFFPQNEGERQLVRDSLALEDGLHMDLRTITMGFLAPAQLVKKSPKTLAAWEKDGAKDPKRDKEIAWWQRFAEVGIPDEDARASAAAYESAFETLEKRLADHPWLLGERISLLEIAWFISLFRLDAAGYPLQRHPRLRAHYLNLRERPAFAAEVDTPGLPGLATRLYGAYRRLRGTTLGDLLARS